MQWWIGYGNSKFPFEVLDDGPPSLLGQAVLVVMNSIWEKDDGLPEDGWSDAISSRVDALWHHP
jgi:hypothetical protein